jgi:predicted PurR-regulated permease PerM
MPKNMISAEMKPKPADVQLHIANRTVVRVLVIIALFVLFVSAVKSLAPLILQLTVAAFVAIAADSLVRALERRGLGRGQAVGLTMLGMFVVIGVMAAIFVPPVVDQGKSLIDHRQDYITDVQNSSAYENLDRRLDLGDNISGQVQDKIGDIPNQLGGAFGAVVGGVFNGITFLFMVTVLLLSGGGVLKSTLRLLPQLTERMWWSVIRGAYRNIGVYVIGALTIALIAGFSLSVILLILGTPFALPLGLWMLLLDMIPLVGATIGAIPAVAVTFIAEGPVDGFIILGFVIVYQQIENVMIQPRIQGRGASLSALSIFVAVLVGSKLLGIVGALFAVPIASVIAIVYNQYIEVSGRKDMEFPSLFDDPTPTPQAELPGNSTS